MSTSPLPPEAVEVQAPPLERFRKRPIDVEMMLWDGSADRAAEIKAWVGRSTAAVVNGRAGFLTPDEVPLLAGEERYANARLYVEHNGHYIDLPIGHRVAKEADGNGFYPISPAAIAGTFDPAPEPLELTPIERAAAARSEHMSTCHEEACVDCMRELRAIRRIVKAVRPHIEKQAREDERRKVADEIQALLADSGALFEWLANHGLADAGPGATLAAYLRDLKGTCPACFAPPVAASEPEGTQQ